MRKLMMILALGVLFAGCNDDTTDSDVSEIAISSEALFEIDHLGGTTEVTVTSNDSWRLAGKKTWCQPSAVAGKSGERVTFTIAPNDTEDARTITYKFFCGNKTIPFTVTQAASLIFDFSSDRTYNFGDKGGEFLIKLSTNVDYTYVINDDAKAWISSPGTRAVHNERISLLVAENTTYSARTGHITFTAAGKEYVITVNQKQNNAIIPEQLFYDVDPTGAQLTINVQSNVAYTVSIPDKYQSWITPVVSRALVPGQASFTIGAAKGTRAGSIIFTNQEAGLSVTVTVKQTSTSSSSCTIPDEYLRKFLVDNGYVLPGDEAGTCEITEAGMTVTSLNCSYQNIASLAGLEAFTTLTELDCRSNSLSTLDISACTSIKTLNANGNVLRSIILGDSQVAELDLSSNNWGAEVMTVSGGNLTWLKLYQNRNLTSLDVSECPGLAYLNLKQCWSCETLYLKTGQTIASLVMETDPAPTIVYK